MIDKLRSLKTWFAARRTWTSDNGASLVEYALLVALIAIICIAAVGILGEATGSQFSDTGSSFSDIRTN